MIFLLKHFDTSLVKFSASEDSAYPEIKILWINEAQRQMLPLAIGRELTPEKLENWLRQRPIPKNREFVSSILAQCGFTLNRHIQILAITLGLSLNDCYWIVPEYFKGTFADFNLYDHPFSTPLAQIAFTGYGSFKRTSLISSPELTTNGMLPKCWRRISGDIWLFKGNTSGASNTGLECYSEFYSYQIAQTAGFNAIPYKLYKWKGIICSACKLFTSKNYSYVPVGNIIPHGGWQAVYEYYQKLGTPYLDALNDMIVFDAIVYNTDRHFGNFGFLVDNHTNQITAPAPLFDHGNSLFNLAGKQLWDDENGLNKYINKLQPCVYDDFVKTAKAILSSRHREKLRRLLTFKFHKHRRYNLPQKWLDTINQKVQERARKLLG